MSEATILIVADDPILGRALTAVLNVKGYQTTSIDSSEWTPNLCASGKYDLLLVDEDLYDGAFAGFCNATRSVSQIPIVVMTGHPKKYSAYALGDALNGHLAKPFGIQELFACIHETVGTLSALPAV